MSVKRQATSDLNHDNWDQDDPNEHEEMGIFRSASQDVLQKRVIRTAKRRSQISGDDAKKSVFSGFGGFNKTQPSSFDFLSNLTNGNKTNGSPQGPKSDSSPSSSLFGGNPAESSGGLFNMPASTPLATKSTTLFGLSTANSAATPSFFSLTKADSTLESPFKIQTQSNETNASNSPGSKALEPKVSSPQVSSGIFGSATGNAKSKSPFTTTTLSSIVQPSSNIDTKANFETPKKSVSSLEKKPEECDSKLRYYSKLKGLNISVSDWIKKHVEETPLCILTPIFRDYEKHLKEIQEEYHGVSKNEKSSKEPEPTTKSSSFAANSLGASAFVKSDAPKETSSVFSLENKPSAQDEKTPFSFGIKPVTNNSIATTSAGFSFGISTSPATSSSTSSQFSLGTTKTTTTNGMAPFSFGVGKPFSFNSNIQTTSEASKDDKEDEDEPPKVEFTPVVEENSVFDKRCKIFIKKDGNFVDKGIGTLYIKKIEESGKHQLLVRANTNLGTVLLNLILASAIPTQRMGKNNVMMVCIPTPDSKPPPTPILIRVKTSEEADALLETLEKYKA